MQRLFERAAIGGARLFRARFGYDLPPRLTMQIAIMSTDHDRPVEETEVRGAREAAIMKRLQLNRDEELAKRRRAADAAVAVHDAEQDAELARFERTANSHRQILFRKILRMFPPGDGDGDEADPGGLSASGGASGDDSAATPTSDESESPSGAPSRGRIGGGRLNRSPRSRELIGPFGGSIRSDDGSHGLSTSLEGWSFAIVPCDVM